jgi:transcriptional regulator with XRE-family HTH domain
MTVRTHAELQAFGAARGAAAWLALLRHADADGRTAGVVTYVKGYGPPLPHVGSSSLLDDERFSPPPSARAAAAASRRYRQLQSLPPREQLQELLAALSLNKSQLAEVLRVSRPTLYDWLHGKEPSQANASRLNTLLRAVSRSGVSSTAPLNARLIRQPIDLDAPSLLDLLRHPAPDEAHILDALSKLSSLGQAPEARRTEREERLRALGFEEPDAEARRANLANITALKDWPKP